MVDFLIPDSLSAFCWALGSNSVPAVTGLLQGAGHFHFLDSSLPFVPPGAVTVGRQERVSLVLVWDLTDAPTLSHRQGLVSPVVACGPHGASFLKPCTLTFKHCAQQPSQVCAYSSNTSLLDAKDWRPLGQSRTHISRDECCILLSHFRWASAHWPAVLPCVSPVPTGWSSCSVSLTDSVFSLSASVLSLCQNCLPLHSFSML